ncbi:MAG: hypothetical protein ACTMKZ_10585 [Brevibacterium aurantiacum]|uniref:Uncharacterized protein n=1 Tax=Brevibacterium aurantiacum TaxID=273384 RepID=A0A2A3YWX3_BREAU|nr:MULTISPECIES: hypothetical protein [Brevibacterium]MDN5735294.1 hypothetical protein [Brevibacterium aurantiacum]MDN5773174.1 hypothetical protein [Brevibacterium aurantiacum]PCC43749.1 hypothetical protein CIK65_03875 [Brevibacterium aurantiacum]PCC56293.1 hypothetical protein CIK58_14120 [Brevibacterium aurantiacum]RCS86953.1 hypothetical protein CIK63_13665 [Brevibacterium aurantiacum]
MRAPSRRTASLLAAAALIVPSAVGVTAAAPAHSSPLCNPLFGCEDSESKEPSPDVKPTAPISPEIPVKPKDPKSPGPTDEPTDEPTETPTDEPSETPTDEPSDEPTDPGGLGVKDPDEEPDDEELNGDFPKDAQLDENAPIFTKTPAAMGSESLSFKGLKGISFAAVPTADGGKITTLKIQAEEISIDGFSLTVRPPEEKEGLLTTADTMTLKGDVTVYIGSITATTKNGDSLTLGPETPPTMDDVEPGLLRVTMGLVGSTADSINYSNTDQELKEA